MTSRQTRTGIKAHSSQMIKSALIPRRLFSRRFKNKTSQSYTLRKKCVCVRRRRVTLGLFECYKKKEMSVRFGPSVTFGSSNQDFNDVANDDQNFSQQSSKTAQFIAQNAPPYAPRLSNQEMHFLAKFMQKKEDKLKELHNTPSYKFVLQVAGACNREPDALLKFDTKDRYFPFAGTKIPSANAVRDLEQNRFQLNKAIVNAMRQKRFEKLKMIVEKQAEVVNLTKDLQTAGPRSLVARFFGAPVPANIRQLFVDDGFPRLNPAFTGYNQGVVDKLVNYYTRNLDILQILFNEPIKSYLFLRKDDTSGKFVMSMEQVLEEVEKLYLDPYVDDTEIRKYGGSDNETTERLILARRVDELSKFLVEFRDSKSALAVRQQILNERFPDEEVGDDFRYFESQLDIEYLFPINVDLAYKFDSIFIQPSTVVETPEYQLATRHVEQLMRFEGEITHSTARERMYSALQWIGRPEILGVSDMTGALYNGIIAAISRLQGHVPGLSNLDKYEQILNCGDNAFISLFGELVGKMIMIAENESPTRAQLDKSLARLERKVSKLLFAMRPYLFSGTRITRRDNRNRSTCAALYAY